jgi:hypothetical protein
LEIRGMGYFSCTVKHTVGHLHMHNYIMNDVLPVDEIIIFKTCRSVTVLIELHMCKWLIVCILFVICIPYKFGTSPLLSYPFLSSDWPNFLQPSHITDTFRSTRLLQHPLEPDSVTLKCRQYVSWKFGTFNSYMQKPKRKPQQFPLLSLHCSITGIIIP